MVQKRGKGHIHSGNSLRKRPHCFKQRYNNYSTIVKRVINCNASANSDQNLQTGIEYSLNKKNRWMLVKDIKQDTLEKQGDVDVNFHISLTKFHNLRQTSNCLRHFSSVKDREDIKPKHGAKYFNAKAVVPKVDSFGMRVIRKKSFVGRKEVIEYERVLADAEVKYEVYQPSPSKLLMEKSLTTKSKTHQTKHRKQKHITYDEYDLDFYEDVSDDDYDENSPNSVPEYSRSDTYDGSDPHNSNFLHRANKYTSPKRFDTKAKVVVINQEEFLNKTKTNSTPQQVQSSATPSLENESVPRRVGIPVEALDPAFLRTMYGDRYTEAGCVPRRLMINIRDEVIQFVKEHNWTPLPNVQAYVCFTCSDEWVADEGVEVVGVTLVSNLNTRSVSVETLSEFEMYTPLDVVESVLKYLTILPKSCFNCKQFSLRTPAHNRFTNFDLINSLYDGPITSKTPEELSQEGVYTENLIVDAKYAVPVTKDETCSICYSTTLESANSTALSSCLHWFCNDCWQLHLVTKIRNRTGKLCCPETRCKSEVDYATLLSFIPLHLASVYFQQQVASQQMWRWCPNPRCGKVLVNQGSKVEAVNVKCSCGTITCYKCLAGGHWPATCEMAANYTQRLIKNGDDLKILNSLTSVQCTFKIKFCPKCGQGIEKNGGCPQMNCLCGQPFCWLCLQSHYGQCTSGRAEFQKINFDELMLSALIKSSPDYFHAVEHRKCQHPIYVRRLRQNAVEVAKHLKPSVTQNTIHDPAASILRLFDPNISNITKDESPFPELSSTTRSETSLEHDCRKTIEHQRNVHRFLQRSLDFALQLHHCAENLSILIEACRHGYSSTASTLVQYLNILNFASDLIEQVFIVGKDQDMRQVIPRLSRLVSTGAEGLKNLTLFVKSEQR